MVFEQLGHLEVVWNFYKLFYVDLQLKTQSGLYDIALKNWGQF